MSNAKKTRLPGQLRIIGGRWRGRQIAVPADESIRPTGDRVRETLFNWLSPMIAGARGLDLFAGTGALGLEALSRGADSVVFVERDVTAAKRIGISLEQLECQSASVVNADAIRFLGGAPTVFDCVWLDPPFGKFDLINLCKLLEGGWLAPGAQVYLEWGGHEDLPELRPGWVINREKTAGRVRFALAQWR